MPLQPGTTLGPYEIQAPLGAGGIGEVHSEGRTFMEVFGIIGMTFGMAGMGLGVIAWGLVGSLRKEFEDLKKNLEDSGVLKEQTESE